MATIEQTRYEVTTIGDVPHGEEHEGRVRHRVREHLGIEAFGVNAMRAVKGDGQVIGEHAEDGIGSRGNEELYVVLSGKATFTVDGDEIKAGPGTLVFVRPGVKRSAVAHGEGTTVLVVGATSGAPFRVSAGELVAPMFDAYRAGDFEEAARIVAGIVAENPGEGMALFNLACCESRLAKTDEALEHLARAIEADGRFAELAREDEDFEELRGEPRFKKLTA
jgi:quercetin dioxygenase-like cupin family protein